MKYQFGRFKNKPHKIRLEENKIMSNIMLKISNSTSANTNEMDFFNPLTSRLYYIVSFSFIKAFIVNYQNNLELKQFNQDELEDILKINENRLITENVKFITHNNFRSDL